MDFQSYSLSISYRISNVVHGGCVDIFWNILYIVQLLMTDVSLNILRIIALLSKGLK